MNTQRHPPTLDDVAKLAGVSTATVSRCLNSPERVAESTRTKVNEAIRTLGYSPNFGARVMAAKRTKTIGAIIPTMENSIFARGLQAFQEGLRKHGYTLLVASSSYRADIEEQQIRALISRGADGLLLIGHDRSEEINLFLKNQNIPALVAWTHSKNQYLPSIGFDNKKSMRALADQVIKLGHKNIAVISGETQGNDRARARLEGVRCSMAEAGLQPNDLQLIETTYSIETGAEAFASLMSGAHPPSVIMCGNDVMAAGAAKQAREMNIKIPQDVSITGFDDIELARIVTPTLTTVHVPHRDMGRKAADLLIKMVEGATVDDALELEATLCMRESLAPPSV